MTDDLPKACAQAWAMIKSGQNDLACHLLAPIMTRHIDADPKPKGYADLLSMFGYTSCMVQKKRKEAIGLCRQAVQMDQLNPRHYYLLALIYIDAESRRKAYKALQAGLKVDPDYKPIHRALRELGSRKSPVLSFLPRSSGINIALGKIRHALFPPRDGR